MKLESAIETLSQAGLRITETRKSLVRTALKMKGAFSAQDLLRALPGKGRGFDLVTIYRNLHAMENAGLICKADFSDDMARYMVSEPGHHHHHHHIICRSCEKVQAVDFCILEAQEQILSKLGFKDIHHRLEFSGLCPGCA
jgi:Fur family transcriptional regulator, ferric uptake regulator